MSFSGTTIRLKDVSEDELSAGDFRFPGGGGDNRKAVKPEDDDFGAFLFRDDGGDLL